MVVIVDEDRGITTLVWPGINTLGGPHASVEGGEFETVTTMLTTGDKGDVRTIVRIKSNANWSNICARGNLR